MYIRDPIHGDIELDHLEQKILDCAEIQRLRTIKQLGTAYLVYPGCTHTRFEHSLGTMAVAKRILTTLAATSESIPIYSSQLITISALLHDITHIPFGHTFEDERAIFPRHDKGHRLDYFLAGDTEIGRQLQLAGLLNDTRAILSGQIKDWRAQIIASALDADLLDYLRRDAYMAGLAQTYDERIFQHFRVVSDQLVLNMVKHNMDRSDIKSEIVHLLRLRYYLSERVYFHHAKVISGAMISKAVELALGYGLTEHTLLQLGDYTLFETLKNLGLKHNPAITALVTAVEHRHLLKRAYILTSESVTEEQRDLLMQNYHFGDGQRPRLEREIAAAFGLNDGEIIVYCPGARTFREAAIPVFSKHGLHKLNSIQPAPPEDINQLQRQYQKLWRFYVFAPDSHRHEVQNFCETYFRLPSEHV
ncbi:MAG: HD domain-containing protein [Peptococcaceae bacterium]|nr:HD domain-containing protein [Peptococcaceae bacterium]